MKSHPFHKKGVRIMLMQINLTGLWVILGFVLVIACCIFASGLKIALEYERLVIFRLGRYARTIGPGIVFIWPIIESAKKFMNPKEFLLMTNTSKLLLEK